MRGLPIGSGHISPQTRAVLLVWSAVVASFVESAATDKDAPWAVGVVNVEQAVLAVHVGDRVDWSALERRKLDEAVGAESTTGGKNAPRAKFGFEQRTGVIC